MKEGRVETTCCQLKRTEAGVRIKWMNTFEGFGMRKKTCLFLFGDLFVVMYLPFLLPSWHTRRCAFFIYGSDFSQMDLKHPWDKPLCSPMILLPLSPKLTLQHSLLVFNSHPKPLES